MVISSSLLNVPFKLTDDEANSKLRILTPDDTLDECILGVLIPFEGQVPLRVLGTAPTTK